MKGTRGASFGLGRLSHSYGEGNAASSMQLESDYDRRTMMPSVSDPLLPRLHPTSPPSSVLSFFFDPSTGPLSRLLEISEDSVGWGRGRSIVSDPQLRY